MPTPAIRERAVAAAAAGRVAAAARAAADAAAAFAAFAADAIIWEQCRDDARTLEAGGDLWARLLWSIPEPDFFRAATSEFRPRWQADPAFGFWLLWWDGVVSGRQLPWDLQEKVALIEPEIWEQGAEVVAARIAVLEEESEEKRDRDRELDDAVGRMSGPEPSVVRSVQAAMERNRRSLPPTFDAIEGLILLELDRMGGKNDFGEMSHAEFQRRRRVLLILFDALQDLRAQLPSSGSVSTKQAERSERVLRLIFKKVGELPIKKADEIAENFWGSGNGSFRRA